MFKHNSFEFKVWLLVAAFVVPLSICLHLHSWAVLRKAEHDQQAFTAAIRYQRNCAERLHLRMQALLQAEAIHPGRTR